MKNEQTFPSYMTIDTIKLIASTDFGERRGMRNGYQCGQCKEIIYTRNKVPGVTPEYINCDCGGTACSLWYRVPQAGVADYEWYRPTDEEYKNLTESQKDHVQDGGLLLRARKEKEHGGE